MATLYPFGRYANITRRYARIDPFIFSYSEQDGFTDYYNGSYREISFLTSGILTIDNRVSIDVFLVGGGGGGGHDQGGGGGGGYTTTAKNVLLEPGSYEIIIGEGGDPASANTENGATGGTTTAFGLKALGGEGGHSYRSTENPRHGGAGGSGGGGGAASGYYAGYGGTNGGYGTNGTASGTYGIGGIGQGSSTRAFGELSGKLYAGGGGGSTSGTPGIGGLGGGANGVTKTVMLDAEPNTGGGGGGGLASKAGTKGGSGVVIMRVRHNDEEASSVLDLYSHGDICEQSVGEWKVHGLNGMTVTFGDNAIEAAVVKTSNRYITTYTRSAVDVGGYTYLKVAFLSTVKGANSICPVMFCMTDRMDVLSSNIEAARKVLADATVVSDYIDETGGEYVYEYVIPQDAENKMKYFQIVFSATSARVSRIWLE